MAAMTTRVVAFASLALVAGLGLLSGGGHVTAAPSPQMAEGAALFASECARCHGGALEGGDGPAFLGPMSGLSTFRNALNMLNYAMENMPGDQPATLSPEQYAQVVGYILSQYGAAVPEEGLTPDNAAGVAIP